MAIGLEDKKQIVSEVNQAAAGALSADRAAIAAVAADGAAAGDLQRSGHSRQPRDCVSRFAVSQHTHSLERKIVALGAAMRCADPPQLQTLVD